MFIHVYMLQTSPFYESEMINFIKTGIEFSMPLDKRKRKSADAAESTGNVNSSGECKSESDNSAVM